MRCDINVGIRDDSENNFHRRFRGAEPFRLAQLHTII